MRCVARAALGGLLAMSIARSPLAAQDGVALDAGIAKVRFREDDVSFVGPWLHATAARQAPTRTLNAAATLAGMLHSAGGSASASAWWRGTTKRLGWRAGGESGTVFGRGLRTSESALTGAQLEWTIGTSGGIRARGSGHLALREAGLLRGGGVEVGGWWRIPYTTISATLLRERAQAQLFADASRDRVLGIVPARYTEASLVAVHDRPWGTLELVAGGRRDPDAAQHLEAQWSIAAVLWQTPNVAFTLNAERALADFIHGADASESFSIGIRFARRPGAAAVRRPTSPTLEVLASTSVPVRRLRVRIPSARSVEMMADFTGWETIALLRSGNEFFVDVMIGAGTHRVALRVDGGPWTPPGNIASIDDDFGGRVGLITVP